MKSPGANFPIPPIRFIPLFSARGVCVCVGGGGGGGVGGGGGGGVRRVTSYIWHSTDFSGFLCERPHFSDIQVYAHIFRLEIFRGCLSCWYYMN